MLGGTAQRSLTAIGRNSAQTAMNAHPYVVEMTSAYEDWAGRHISLVRADLRRKHSEMARAAFPFLRATFYLWVRRWHENCPDLAEAPRVLGVGDLHVENFGTWRDAEGRLVWGINDFDEAYPLAYTNDLVRLATSAMLAVSEGKLLLTAKTACEAILSGYRETLASKSGRSFVLEEEHPALRAMALGQMRDPQEFWAKLRKFRSVAAPRSVKKLLRKQLPGADELRIIHRIAGIGSLGRPRFALLAQCDGGLIAREAKAVLPSAYGWAMHLGEHIHYEEILGRAIRAPDPFLKVKKGWVLRRLAPHCSRIELDELPNRHDERRILKAMGCETANVHLGSAHAISSIHHDLRQRGPHWLLHAANKMADATHQDWNAWRKR